jgi:gliding motility-associated-like protein
LTDSKNCTADTSFTVIDNFSFVAEIRTKSDVTCFGANNGTATVKVFNGTPPYSYQWSDGPLLSDSVRTGMHPFSYIVTVTDASSKTAQASVSINSPLTALVIVLDPENLKCNGDNSGVIDLTVTGGSNPYSYSWSNGYTGEDLVNVPADVYSVTVTDASNCFAQDTKTISEPAEIGLSAAVTKALNCYGDANAIATATATGGTPPNSFSYLWNDPGAQITPVATGLSAGNYTVTVTDSNNCSKTTPVQVLQPEELKRSNLVIVAPSCPGSENGSIVPTYTGGTGSGYEYVWSNNVFTRINTDLPAGQYILTMNDANNCFVSDTFNLADPGPLTIDSIQISDVTCLGKNDGTVTIYSSGGTGIIEYSADNGVSFGTSSLIGSLAAGAYTAVIRDENECPPVNNIPFSLTVLDTVGIDTIIVTDATCMGIDDGSVQITAFGGSGIYEYSTDGGTNYVSDDLITSLAGGDYTVTVKDDQDCISEQQPVTITYADTVEIASVTHTNVTCADNTDGTITITAQGGTRAYQYSVDDGDNFAADSLFSGLPQGNYSVIVRDANLCLSESQAVTLDAPESCGLVIFDAISPNGDGKNDVWNIINAGPKIKVEIFNIWGKSVFSSSGYSDPWDGKYNGNDLPAGTYYYVIDPGDGSANITGAVSIVK